MCLNWGVGVCKKYKKNISRRIRLIHFLQSLPIITHNYYANSSYFLYKRNEKWRKEITKIDSSQVFKLASLYKKILNEWLIVFLQSSHKPWSTNEKLHFLKGWKSKGLRVKYKLHVTIGVTRQFYGELKPPDWNPIGYWQCCSYNFFLNKSGIY